MFEHITKAFTLGFYKRKEEDKIFILFTEDFGKLKVRAPGGAKILSRLSPHLDIWNLTTVKIVEKNNLTLVDAFLVRSFFEEIKNNRKFFGDIITAFNVLNKVFPEGLPDVDLWNFLLESFLKKQMDFVKFLSFLGYNPQDAKCFLCGEKTFFAFDLKEQNLVCKNCSFHFPSDNLLFIG